MPAKLRYVDPTRKPGIFARAYAALAASRVARFVSRHINWKLDPFLLRVTHGRLATTLVFPTAVLETEGGQERRTTAQRDHLLQRRRPRHDRCLERRGRATPRLVLQPSSTPGRHLRWDPDARCGGGRRG